jgi:hypothetical protein
MFTEYVEAMSICSKNAPVWYANLPKGALDVH